MYDICTLTDSGSKLMPACRSKPDDYEMRGSTSTDTMVSSDSRRSPAVNLHRGTLERRQGGHFGIQPSRRRHRVEPAEFAFTNGFASLLYPEDLTDPNSQTRILTWPEVVLAFRLVAPYSIKNESEDVLFPYLTA